MCCFFFKNPLPRSRQPFAGPYSESQDSGQHPHTKFLEDTLQYYFLIYAFVSQVAYSHEVCVCVCVRALARPFTISPMQENVST